MSDSRITAVVLTLNEERHLPECLSSLGSLTDQALVVDSGSTDATAQIARAHGAEVIERAFTGYASQRNAALDLVQTQWTLFVDADERLTSELVCEIRERTRAVPDSVAGFWIPRRNIVVGRELRGGGWWPDHQARLIRTGHGRYDPEKEVHEVVQFDGDTEKLDAPMIHINFESWRECMLRQRAYTLRQAQAGLIPPPGRISWVSRPVREFLRRFITLRGYRDGTTGLALASIMAMEEFRGCLLTRRKRSG